jgi:hypothetical protein
VDFHNIGDLDYRVTLGSREFTGHGRAFNVVGEDSKGRNLGELSFAGQAVNFIKVVNIDFNLAKCFLASLGSNLPVLFFYPNPGHPANFTVDHKAQSVWHI